MEKWMDWFQPYLPVLVHTLTASHVHMLTHRVKHADTQTDTAHAWGLSVDYKFYFLLIIYLFFI